VRSALHFFDCGAFSLMPTFYSIAAALTGRGGSGARPGTRTNGVLSHFAGSPYREPLRATASVVMLNTSFVSCGDPEGSELVRCCASSNNYYGFLRHMFLRSGASVLSPCGGAVLSYVPIVRRTWRRLSPAAPPQSRPRSQNGGRDPSDCVSQYLAGRAASAEFPQPHALGREYVYAEHLRKRLRVEVFDPPHGHPYPCLPENARLTKVRLAARDDGIEESQVY